MTAIHHATLKRAAKVGIVIEQPEHGYYTASKDGKLLADGGDAKAVLAEAEKIAFPKAEKPSRAPKAKKPGKKKAKKRADDEDDGEETEEGEESKSVIKAKYKAKYKPHKDTCGDKLRKAMNEYLRPEGEEIDPKRFYALAKENGIDGHRWDHLQRRGGGWNVGMASMGLRNVIDGMVRRKESVTIGGKPFTG